MYKRQLCGLPGFGLLAVKAQHLLIEFADGFQRLFYPAIPIQRPADLRNPVSYTHLHYKSFAAEQVSASEISRAWGTPKPTLSNSYRSELLNLRTFPTLMGYSSRIMAESWESNLLYWAEVGDETGSRPAQLNVLVPEWTQKVVERIFASHLEDLSLIHI